jgi:DNA helicase-2/ATP-dependent DNA helicase PcrA
MEDLSSGKSWLSFARGSSAIDYGDSSSATDNEQGAHRKERKKFTGKTYDSVDSIAEFFKQRETQLGNTGGGFDTTRNASRNISKRGRGPAPADRGSSPPIRTGSSSDRVDRGSSPPIRTGSSSDRVDPAGPPSSVAGQQASSPSPPSPVVSLPSSSDFVPGSYVKHAKYGRGLVLRREGVGESLKLTVTFPGYGQKKLIQKYAGLEEA